MAITSERLKQTFSEGGAQEIYREVRAEGNFLGFAHRYVFDSDYRVARVSFEELPGIQTLCMKLAYRMCSFYPELMDELKRTIEAMEIDYYKPAIKCLRKRILSGKYK